MEIHARHIIVVLHRSYFGVVLAEEMPLQLNHARLAHDVVALFIRHYHIDTHNVENKQQAKKKTILVHVGRIKRESCTVNGFTTTVSSNDGLRESRSDDNNYTPSET